MSAPAEDLSRGDLHLAGHLTFVIFDGHRRGVRMDETLRRLDDAQSSIGFTFTADYGKTVETGYRMYRAQNWPEVRSRARIAAMWAAVQVAEDEQVADGGRRAMFHEAQVSRAKRELDAARQAERARPVRVD